MRRFALALILLAASAASAATFTVNDLGDAPDAAPFDGICATAGAVCTLRAAIDSANLSFAPDTIQFSVAGTIMPTSGLQSSGAITIDGTTAPGYAGTPVVVIDGASSVNYGLFLGIFADNSVVTALEIRGFTVAGLAISSSSNVHVRRCFLHANLDGLWITSSGTTIGGADGQGNVISGNTRHGILLENSFGTNTISDNFIGTDPTGATGDGNGEDGIHVFSVPTPPNIIMIGGAAGAENVISDNEDDGVHMDFSSSVTVAGNFIGTDITGMIGLGNGDAGVEITTSNDNIIGASGRTTLIADNFGPGVSIISGTGNVIDGCLIGTDITGLAALGNDAGVVIESNDNTVGTASIGNVISGNFFEGVVLSGITSGAVRNNLIGLGNDGATILGNGSYGILLDTVSGVQIEDNTVSGNGLDGLDALDSSSTSILGNVIGLTADGTDTRGNGALGMLILDSTTFTIGSTSAGNVVSGNSTGGIVLAGTTDSVLAGNLIGTDGTGMTAQPNLGTGVELFAANDNTITDNLMSGNEGHGLELTFGSSNNTVLRNGFGVTGALTALGNLADGVNVCDTAVGNTIGNGNLADGNVIRHNGANGIGVEPTALQGNTWAGNSIDENELLGIDIGIDGVTPNDDDDPDTGANNIQNYPVITAAVGTATTTWIQGTVNSTPSTALTLHFYSSPAADPSGFGEGFQYRGATNVTTDASGDATFNFTFAGLMLGQFATVTATSADGTSEFSEAVEVIAAPTVEFSANNYPTTEGSGTVLITVNRTGDLSATTTVNFATSPNTATAGADYTHIAGTLTFAPTETQKTFLVTILQDTSDEPSELINLTLSNPTAASLGTQSTATITIADDDLPPTITIDDVPLNEGNAGTTSFTFTVSLSAPSGFPVSVDYATSPGTATAGTDYTTIPTTTLNIPPNTLSATITVNVAGDLTPETDDTFFVNLTNAINASITDNQGLGTILNDDAFTANLSITKTADSPTFTPGQQITFTITVTNNGPNDATGVVVTDVLPAGTTFVSATGPCTGTTTIVCTYPTLVNGATETISLVVTANGSAPITNTATVTAVEGDPNPTNNTAAAAISPFVMIPTLSEWGLLLVAAALALVALRSAAVLGG